MSSLLPRGRLDIETLQQWVADERIETVLAVFPDIYGRLLGKRITGHFFRTEQRKFDAVVTNWEPRYFERA